MKKTIEKETTVHTLVSATIDGKIRVTHALAGKIVMTFVQVMDVVSARQLIVNLEDAITHIRDDSRKTLVHKSLVTVMGNQA